MSSVAAQNSNNNHALLMTMLNGEAAGDDLKNKDADLFSQFSKDLGNQDDTSVQKDLLSAVQKGDITQDQESALNNYAQIAEKQPAGSSP